MFSNIYDMNIMNILICLIQKINSTTEKYFSHFVLRRTIFKNIDEDIRNSI